MNKIKRSITSLAALLLFSSVGMAVPLSAHAEDGSSSGTPTGSSDSTSLTRQLQLTARQKLELERKNVKAHTETERHKSCDARKTSLQKRMANAVSHAEKHKKVIDENYAKVKNFYTTKNLNVANYSTLTGNVDTAAATAQTSIDALKALNVNVDCTSQTVAESVSSFQQAVSLSRDSLKSYRKSLVELIKAIRGDSTSTDKTDHSSTNTTGQ